MFYEFTLVDGLRVLINIDNIAGIIDGGAGTDFTTIVLNQPVFTEQIQVQGSYDEVTRDVLTTCAQPQSALRA